MEARGPPGRDSEDMPDVRQGSNSLHVELVHGFWQGLGDLRLEGGRTEDENSGGGNTYPFAQMSLVVFVRSQPP